MAQQEQKEQQREPLPKSVFDEYDRLKREWVRNNPRATEKEYDAAINEICDKVGL